MTQRSGSEKNSGSARGSRRAFLARSLAAAAAAPWAAHLALAGRASAAQAEAKPNFVFIIADDMGWADLGCYGQDAYPTPHLDRMAAEGLRFTDAYSGCTVCAPARSTLMTGLHMGHTPVRGNSGGIPLPDGAVTVAEVLKRAGYACGGFGKWGLGDLDTPGVPEKQGFDEFFGYYDQVHAHYYYPDYLIDTGKKVPLPGNKDFYKTHKGSGGMPVETGGLEHQFSQVLILDRMKAFIRKHKDRPFFCYAPWTPPHARYEMPETDPAWQAVKDKPWNANVKGHAAFNMMVDRQVGEVLALLRELGLDEKTVVFFCSDNGASMRNEGTLDSSGSLTGFKRSMHEGGIRTPLIVRWPGKVKPGGVSDLPVYFPDVMPTLCDLAGASALMPKDVDGLSIAPTLLGRPGEQKRHEYMYWEWTRAFSAEGKAKDLSQAVRYGKWKALRSDAGRPWELYDLSKDLAEKTNLADAHPDIVAKIDAWVKATRVDPPPQIELKAPSGQYR